VRVFGPKELSALRQALPSQHAESSKDSADAISVNLVGDQSFPVGLDRKRFARYASSMNPFWKYSDTQQDLIPIMHYF
jgi:hypothetical protein